MKTEITDLEEILNSEIEAYSKLEEYITNKKDCLIKGDIEKLQYVDIEIEKFSSVMERLEVKRKEISSKFGNENITLKEIIKRIEDENQAERILGSRRKLESLIDNIKKQNSINARLIQNSLKIIEHSVLTIANALVPESSAYNNFGKVQTSKTGISSIIEEA